MKLAIIPARGGSKRIARKNIKPFCGKPIIAYSIQNALDAKIFDKVIVSTEDEEIANCAKMLGAEVPFYRPRALADDHTGTNEVVKQALQWFHDQGIQVDYACCLYATAPLLKPEYLVQGMELLEDSRYNFAFSVTTFAFPIQRAIRLNSQGEVEALWPENRLVRSQDLEETYHDAGQFYWGKANAFLDDKVLFSNASVPVVLPRYLVQDIDTMEDWKLAEFLYKYRESGI